MIISIGEIIERSWEHYARNFKKLLPLMICLFIPNFVLGLVGMLSLYLEYLGNSSSTGMYVLIDNIVVLAVFVASMIFTLWASMALAKNLGLIVSNKPAAAIKELFSNTSHLIWPVIYTSVLMMLAVLGGTLLLIIPGIIFSIWFCFTFMVIIFEEKRGVNALKESNKLVAGRWWKIFFRLLIPGFFYGIFYIIIVNLIGYVLRAIFGIDSNMIYNATDTPYAVYTMTSGFFSGILSALFSPLTALTTILLYFSAKENPVTINPVIEAEKK